MYTKQQKEDIENILEIFNDYVQNNMAVDVLWSDKAGYLFGSCDNLEDERRTYEYEQVLSAEELLDKFQMEFYLNIMENSEEELAAQCGDYPALMVKASKIAASQVQKMLEEHNSPIKYEYSVENEPFYRQFYGKDEKYEDD